MSNTYTPRQTVRETYQTYHHDVVPKLDAAITAVTGETERDDSSTDGKPRNELSTLGYKVCGAFALRTATAPIDIVTNDGTKILEQGEPFMGIHLLEVEAEQAHIAYGRQSLREVATYLRETDDTTGTMLGSVTYARLGQTASRAFGFEVSELPVLMDPLENPDSRPVFVHMPISDFVESY